jgi:hypothetical protein
MLLVAIPLLLLISFVFYLIASIDGAMFGSPDDEIDSIISEKMRDIINSIDKETGGELSGHIGDSFDKITFGIKIVPNMDNHNFLLQRMAMVGGPQSDYNGLESAVSYNWDALGDQSVNPYFFEWNGASHMMFPKFNFDEDHVPVGDAAKMCIGLSWVSNKKRN